MRKGRSMRIIGVGEPIKAETYNFGLLRGILIKKNDGYIIEVFSPEGFETSINLWVGIGKVEKCEDNCEQCQDRFKCFTTALRRDKGEL